MPYVAKNVSHVLATGQSLSTGATSTATSLTQPYANLMLAGGVQAINSYSNAFVPLVEATTETMSSAMANMVTSLLPAHVMLVSVHGQGATAYAGLAKGSVPYGIGINQAQGGFTRAGLAGQSYVVRMVTCVHGESDSSPINTHYAADIIQWQQDYQADVRTITGQADAVPMLHSQNSTANGSTIPLQMLQAHIAAPGKVVLVGPKYHVPYNDGLHLATAGYRRIGEDYARAYKRIIVDGLPWEPLRPKTVTRAGAVITIVYYVPSPPIVLDTTRVAAAVNYGFGFVNDASTPAAQPAAGIAPAISSVAVVAPDTIQITLASVPAAPCRVRYAIDYVDFPLRGNLRDSDTTVSRFGFDLFNWGVSFEAYLP